MSGRIRNPFIGFSPSDRIQSASRVSGFARSSAIRPRESSGMQMGAEISRRRKTFTRGKRAGFLRGQREGNFCLEDRLIERLIRSRRSPGDIAYYTRSGANLMYLGRDCPLSRRTSRGSLEFSVPDYCVLLARLSAVVARIILIGSRPRNFAK